jgi:glycosyltransferase involved in cell wall biosynthesis
VKSSDFLVADSKGIQDYLKETYNVPSKYIAYGSFLFSNPNASILSNYDVSPYGYNMLIARLEPENSIEMILDGVVGSKNNIPFLVVGKHDTNKFGAYLKDKYKDHTNIRFIGGVYNQEHLNNLRYYSKVYFHGHTVGGTNPSLLEAMASDSLVVAHDNQFNKAILNNDTFYFQDAKEVTTILMKITNKEDHRHFLDNNRGKIKNIYSWDIINNAYLKFMEQTYEQNR